MAHFAQLDSNNVVLQVIVVANKDTADAQGNEQEWIGQGFCARLLGGTQDNWKQTSYHGNFRKNYAGIGYIYREDIDAFVTTQPYPSWVLDENAQWQAPTAMPTDGTLENPYIWDESTQTWAQQA